MQKESLSDVIIVGAGAVGLLTALLLSQKGLRVCLLEKGNPSDALPKDNQNGHTTALMSRAIALLQKANIWKELSSHCQEMRTLRIIDPSAEELLQSDFKASEIGKSHFGYNVPQNILRAFLLKAVKKSKAITYLPQTEIEAISYSDNTAQVTTAQNTAYTAPLLLACDGRGSLCRKWAGIEVDEQDYAQTALTFVIEHAQEHNCVSTEIHHEGGPLTFVPLKDHKSSAIVWVNTSAQSEALLKLKKQELLQQLQDQSLGILGRIQIISDVASWPLKRVKAKSYISQRLVLLGEAAHALSPVGAQGLNLSYRDVEILCDLITESARLGQDIGGQTVLKSYQKMRSLDVAKRVYGVDILNHFIKTESDLEKYIRRSGLKLVSNILPLKHLLMREGMSPDTGLKKTG